MSWGRLPWGLRERPFDIYAATLLLVVGIFSLFDDFVFEKDIGGNLKLLITIVSVYFIAASSVILTALFKNPKKCPAFVLFGEMYGWMFVSAASAATTLLIGTSFFFVKDPSVLTWSLWLFVWGMLTAASAFRFLDLRSKYRRFKK